MASSSVWMVGVCSAGLLITGCDGGGETGTGGRGGAGAGTTTGQGGAGAGTTTGQGGAGAGTTTGEGGAGAGTTTGEGGAGAGTTTGEGGAGAGTTTGQGGAGAGTSTGGGGSGGAGGGSGGAGGAGDPCAGVVCSAPATCEEQGGAGVCVCPTGYLPQGNGCLDVDECQDGTAMCAVGELCTNVPGDYFCGCAPGSIQVGQVCRPAGTRSFDAGAQHVCRIDAGGTLSCWGMLQTSLVAGNAVERVASPQLVSPATSWVTIAAAGTTQYNVTCGIQQPGTLWCWGYGAVVGATKLAPAQVGSVSSWAGVDVSTTHACAVRQDGSLWCWGANTSGQLGDPLLGTVNAPAKIGADVDWEMVTVGGNHSCAIKSSGALHCWGSNSKGQVGIGAAASQSTPAKIGGDEWRVVDAGDNHTCAVKLDGSLWCWGSNSNFELELGIGVSGDKSSPVQVGAALDWRDVDAGSGYTCATKKDGSLWCWGQAAPSVGALPDQTLLGSKTPFRVDLGVDWVEARAGSNPGGASETACGRRADGSMACWGVNTHGQLGQGSFANKAVPVDIPGAQWKTALPGLYRTCGVKTNGTLWCWGHPFLKSFSDVPAQVGSSSAWVDVTGGADHACALKNDGTVWCWGGGVALGLGANVFNAAAPTQVGAATDWAAISAASGNTCGIRSNGDLYCWGGNQDGQVGNGGGATVSSPVQVGAGTVWASVAVGAPIVCAVTEAGALFCWGKDIGSTPVQVGSASDWTAVSVGEGPSLVNGRVCGLRGAGTLHCWGAPPLGDGSFNVSSTVPVQIGAESTWTAVGSSANAGCAIKAGQGAFCWGLDLGLSASGGYELDLVPTLVPGTQDFVDIEVGANHICGRRSGGQVACWGYGSFGELGTGDAWGETVAPVLD